MLVLAVDRDKAPVCKHCMVWRIIKERNTCIMLPFTIHRTSVKSV